MEQTNVHESYDPEYQEVLFSTEDFNRIPEDIKEKLDAILID